MRGRHAKTDVSRQGGAGDGGEPARHDGMDLRQGELAQVGFDGVGSWSPNVVWDTGHHSCF